MVEYCRSAAVYGRISYLAEPSVSTINDLRKARIICLRGHWGNRQTEASLTWLTHPPHAHMHKHTQTEGQKPHMHKHTPRIRHGVGECVCVCESVCDSDRESNADG